MKKFLLSIIYFLACLLSTPAQTLYSTTVIGGNNGGGTINKFITSSNDLTIAKSFEVADGEPAFTNFMQASDGKLYGMTNGGGNSFGALFSFDPSSSTYTKLKDFDNSNGANPLGSLIQASDGKLYGMTQLGGSSGTGVIFSFDPSSSTYTKLKDFDDTDGASPYGSLVQAKDGRLYGMTIRGGSNGAGVIFSFDPSLSTYTKLKDFDNTDGANPNGSLIQAKDGRLYGMTTGGGNSGYGVIFSFDPSSSTYALLKEFDNTNGANPIGSLIQASDGKLYGMTVFGGSSGYGVIFSLDPSTSSYTNLKDFDNTNGGNPQGSLLPASDGKLYGMTSSGGSSGAGVIFSFDPSSSTYMSLKDFDNNNGGYPGGGLIQAGDGKLYGMTTNGGISGRGVIFSFDPSVFAYTKLKDFGINESGSNVSASLIQARDGRLYGMTVNGGSSGRGVIFSFNPLTSTYLKLMDFDNTNGGNPRGSLMQASDGKLYGMTFHGGSSGVGVIFSFDPSSSTYTKLKDFDNTNGANPIGSLIQASDGKLYGVTPAGGSGDYGNIFSFDPSSSTFTILKEFDYTNGASPYGSLIQASDGKLYGTTIIGGSNNGVGVIFSFDPSNSTYTNLKEFDFTNGGLPQNGLVQASDGKLYGMTGSGGSSFAGVIFSFDPSTSTYIDLKDFDITNGGSPFGKLIQASDGKLYGTTNQGGSNGSGVIFSFDPSSSTYTKLQDYNGANGANSYIGTAFIEVKPCIAGTYYQDADGDGYGNADSSVQACSPPAGYVTDNTDCDDTKALVHPGATEICGNGIDDNCNGQTDENCGIPTITINNVSVNESQGVAVVTVALSHASLKPVWLLYFTEDGTAVSWGRSRDYKAKIDLLAIRPGLLTATISIKINKDNIAEATEYFDVVLLASLNATIADRSGRVYISDDTPVTNSKTEFSQKAEITSANSFEIKVMPNPTASRFNLLVQSNNKTDKINMKVIDVQGKLIETRSNLTPGQTLHIGSNYRSGTYFIQAIQGKQRRTTTVTKISE